MEVRWWWFNWHFSFRVTLWYHWWLLLTRIRLLDWTSPHVILLLHGVRDGIVPWRGSVLQWDARDLLTLFPGEEVPVRAEVQVVAVPHEDLLARLDGVDTGDGGTQTEPAINSVCKFCPSVRLERGNVCIFIQRFKDFLNGPQHPAKEQQTSLVVLRILTRKKSIWIKIFHGKVRSTLQYF